MFFLGAARDFRPQKVIKVIPQATWEPWRSWPSTRRPGECRVTTGRRVGRSVGCPPSGSNESIDWNEGVLSGWWWNSPRLKPSFGYELWPVFLERGLLWVVKNQGFGGLIWYQKDKENGMRCDAVVWRITPLRIKWLVKGVNHAIYS